MVFSTSHVTPQKASHAPNPITGGATGFPETGDFDIFASLLGLQASSSTELKGLTPDLLQGKPGVKNPFASMNGTEDAAFPENLRKDRTPWNLIFPGLSPQVLGQKTTEISVKSVATSFSPHGLVPQTKGENELVAMNPGNQPGVGQPNLLSFGPKAEGHSAGTFPALVKSKGMEKGQGVEPEKVLQAADVNRDPRFGKSAEHEAKLSALSRGSVVVDSYNPQKAVQNSGEAQAEKSSHSPPPSHLTQVVPQHGKGESHPALQAAAHGRVQQSEHAGQQVADKEAKVASNSATKKTISRSANSLLDSTTAVGTSSPTLVASSVSKSDSMESSAKKAPFNVPELFSKIDTLVQRGGGKMTVSLNPPHIGKLDIQVTTRGKKVEIEMLSDSREAKTLLESKLGELKQSLHSQDLQLAKVDVQVNREVTVRTDVFSNPSANQSFSSPSQSFADSSGNRQFSNTPQRSESALSAAPVSQGVAKSEVAASSSGRVDLRI